MTDSAKYCLQPVDTPPTWFIETFVAVQHLHHETLAAVLDALFQEYLNFVRGFAVRRFCVVEFPRHHSEMLA